jgi:hypothetical protein
MSTSDGESRVGPVCSNKRGVLEHDVQHRQRDSEGETDWKTAFQVLSASLAKQFVSGDVVYLVSRDVKKYAGEEAFRVMGEAACLNRDRLVHEFMG